MVLGGPADRERVDVAGDQWKTYEVPTGPPTFGIFEAQTDVHRYFLSRMRCEDKDYFFYTHKREWSATEILEHLMK